MILSEFIYTLNHVLTLQNQDQSHKTHIHDLQLQYICHVTISSSHDGDIAAVE